VSFPLCGNFILSDVNGTTLASGGGSFGALSSNQFCLNNGIAPLWHQGDDSAYLRQAETNNKLDVFPTLAKDNLSVNYSLETTKPIQLSIVDINGQVMQQFEQSVQH